MKQGYNPNKYFEEDKELHKVITQLLDGYFSPSEPSLFHPIVRTLLDGDRFFVLADYAAYMVCQEEVATAYSDRDRWTKMAILNVARSGKFSSDRAIREYAESIWNISRIQPQ
jgi:starch phosphorylase